jgi:hypothetical protein
MRNCGVRGSRPAPLRAAKQPWSAGAQAPAFPRRRPRAHSLSAFHRPPIVNRKSQIENSFCLSKYISLFISTYAGLCRDRRRHARRQLNLVLNLYLYLYLYLSLNLNLFLFQKPNASSLASKLGSNLRLNLNLNLNLFLPRLHPPGQSPVCTPYGEIVFPPAAGHYM